MTIRDALHDGIDLQEKYEASARDLVRSARERMPEIARAAQSISDDEGIDDPIDEFMLLFELLSAEIAGGLNKLTTEAMVDGLKQGKKIREA